MLDDPMDLIGHSFGATVVLRLAVAYPDKVRSLTMIEPVFFAVVEQENPEAFAAHKRLAKPFEDALVAGDRVLAAKIFSEHWGDGRAWERLTQTNRDALTTRIHLIFQGDPAVYGDRAGLLKPGALDAVKMPCLLVQGSASPTIVGLINAGLVRRLPGAQNIVVNGAGHMVPITHPEPVATALCALFSRAP
jgi:lipase